MKKLLALVIALAVSSVFADETTNLITNTWSGASAYTGTGQGFSGGNTPGYNSANNTIYFGYTSATVAQTIAINNALQGSGVKVGGVSYGFTYLNQDTTAGTLSSVVDVKNNLGSVIHSYAASHGTTTNWTQFAQTQNFTNPYELANLGSVSMSITGQDNRFWAGYYGPQVKDAYLKLNYTAATITNPTFGDDTYVSVPLQFGFPFYGRTFTNSWMHSNGVVSFLDPAVPLPNGAPNPGQWAYCCGDQPTVTKPEFSYMIAPLWTDLYPTPSSTFRTEGTTTYQKYTWNNIGEISNTNNLNSFTLEIRPTGFIGINYEKINIQNQQTWVGLTGDTVANQINERFWGVPGLNAHLSLIPNWSVNDTPADMCMTNPLSSPSCPGYTDAMCLSNPLYATTCAGYQQAFLSQQCALNTLYDVQCPGYATAYLNYQCSINPLYSTTCQGYETAYFNQQCTENPLYNSRCSGYAQAYHDQQCSINPLYATTCSGYASAYFSQQCSINALYSPDCPGYRAAYFDQQCSLNPLYDRGCPGYASAYFTQQCTLNPLYNAECPGYARAYFSQQCSLNPLYNAECPGYGQAYFTQQCSLNPLYNSQCSGYTEAYHAQQCSLNPLYAQTCPGYAVAYKSQQCSLNQLYATDCPGYAAAYKSQQCTLNGLYATDCPNYAQAYFDQQCTLDGLYSTRCPNYSTAYATKLALEASKAAAAVASSNATNTTSQPIVNSTSSNSSPTNVAVVSDPVVNSVVTSTSTSASPASAATTTVPLVQTAAVTTATPTAAAPAAAQSEEKKGATSTSVSTTTAAPAPSAETKPTAPTARQELQAKREAAAKAKAVEDGKNLAANMGKIADIESQKMVQNVVLQAMAFTPGFDKYSLVRIQDVTGYKPVTVYNGQVNVDNKRLGRGLYGPSDRLHNDLVESQYRQEK